MGSGFCVFSKKYLPQVHEYILQFFLKKLYIFSFLGLGIYSSIISVLY